jgi:hypothetical protein
VSIATGAVGLIADAEQAGAIVRRGMMKQLSRREFASLAAAAAAPLAFGQGLAGSPPITADDPIARIKTQIGVPWKPETIDGLKAGEGTTVVTGVATMALATPAGQRHPASLVSQGGAC